jgi:hypothetical protein
LTPCCGLEVHYPTQGLNSVKEPGNTFNLAKSGQELSVLDIFLWDIYRDPPPQYFSNIKIDI